MVLRNDLETGECQYLVVLAWLRYWWPWHNRFLPVFRNRLADSLYYVIGHHQWLVDVYSSRNHHSDTTSWYQNRFQNRTQYVYDFYDIDGSNNEFSGCLANRWRQINTVGHTTNVARWLRYTSPVQLLAIKKMGPRLLRLSCVRYFNLNPTNSIELNRRYQMQLVTSSWKRLSNHINHTDDWVFLEY